MCAFSLFALLMVYDRPTVGVQQDEFADDEYLPDFQAILGERTGVFAKGSHEPDMQRRKLWAFIAKKEIPKVCACQDFVFSEPYVTSTLLRA